ncbi:MAG TPA: glycoside hydrolase family 2 TIM barrel-domain containing protein [Bacteroidota bacterium]|nr:glycoside hydrolase family 2 TIM barrel-domain containing protein [Bacteroidota bacterium]
MKGPRNPRHVRSLNGIWDIAPGDAVGAAGPWRARVPVPSLVDCAVPTYEWQASPYHWYRLRFNADDDLPGETATIRIGQAMFGTSVWLNGERIGEDIACYTSQEYDAAPYLSRAGPNEIIVRVGMKDTLPPESAVGKDQERQTFIPGIWGDVSLVHTGNPRAVLVQVIPRVRESVAGVSVTVRNSSPDPLPVTLVSRLREHVTGRPAGSVHHLEAVIPGAGQSVHRFDHAVDPLVPWSPEHPFLYDHCVDVVVDGVAVDTLTTRFGMREFTIRDKGFFLNGERIYLKGGNIAFHRFLSDAGRKLLPWDDAWVRKMLVDIPRKHNFNFFRAHIGQMYSRWYDIADEGGMLLQNEWMFWTTTGSESQITKEFTRWLEDNWNHPSIVIWDPLNESSDPVVQNTVVPRMKQLDPTRPWESVDFLEEHPYIYSLGPVLNDGKFGFARGLREIEDSRTPAVVNEFLWWWLDAENNPTALTTDVVERWLGSRWTKDDLVAHQSFLASELVELFRRMRVDAIQPFVYLSNSAGPTGHWFLGDIAGCVPKPLLATLRNVFAPFGVSVELWDRHFAPGETRNVRLFVFNDDPVERAGKLRCGVVRGDGAWMSESLERVKVPPSGSSIVPVRVSLPGAPGPYEIVAELSGSAGISAVSRKIAHVFAVEPAGLAREVRCLVSDSRGEVAGFLAGEGFSLVRLGAEDPAGCSVIIVGEGMLRDPEYIRNIPAVTAAVRGGAVLIAIEPEFGNRAEEALGLIDDMAIAIARREDADRGGYDSYVFPEDVSHPLWKNIAPAHLKMFNGAYGGEMVSQHTVRPGVPMDVLARCGLKLAYPAVLFARAGSGCVVVSRIQTRGRLTGGGDPEHLFARRVDPVARQYMINLVTAFLPGRQRS